MKQALATQFIAVTFLSIYLIRLVRIKHMTWLIFTVTFLLLPTVQAAKDTMITYLGEDGSIVEKRDYYSFCRKSFLWTDGTVGVYDYWNGLRQIYCEP
jgi:hypothetical protein